MVILLSKKRKNPLVNRVFTVRLVSSNFGSLADVAINSISQGFFLGIGVGMALTVAGAYALKKTFFKSNTSIQEQPKETLLNKSSTDLENKSLTNLENKCSLLQEQVDSLEDQVNYLEEILLTFQASCQNLGVSVRSSPIGRLTTALLDGFSRYLDAFRPLSDAESEQILSSFYECFFYDNLFFKIVFLFSLLSLALLVSYIKKRKIQ